MPDLTPELVRSLIDSQLARLRSFGYIRLPGGSSETVEAEAARYLGNRNYERVMIGAGLDHFARRPQAFPLSPILNYGAVRLQPAGRVGPKAPPT